MYDWKKTRLQLLDYARAEHPATDFIHFHLFCPFTHQATANVYFWPQGVEVKLFTKDYLNKRTAFTRLQMITSLPQETQHTELCKSKQWRNILYSKSKRTLGKCSYWGHECKLMCGMLFLTKTRKTLSLTMKTNAINSINAVYCMSNMANDIYSSLFKLKMTQTEWKQPAFLSSMTQHHVTKMFDIFVIQPSCNLAKTSKQLQKQSLQIKINTFILSSL